MNDLQNLSSAEELAGRCLGVLEKTYRLEGTATLIKGVPTGCTELDRLTSGLQPADLVVVAGWRLSGHDSLVLEIAKHAAVRAGVPVLLFSPARKSDRIFQQMLCAEARVSYADLLAGSLSRGKWQRIEAASKVLAGSCLYLDDTPMISVEQMLDVAWRLDARLKSHGRGLGLIAVDHFQTVGKGLPGAGREENLFEVARGLKRLAVKLQVPVLVLCELSLEDDEKLDRPDWQEIADLGGYGNIQRAADVFVIVRRRDIYEPAPTFPGITEIHVPKNRGGGGGGGMTTLTFNSRFGTFQDYRHRRSCVPRHSFLEPESIPLCRKLRCILQRDFNGGFSASKLLYHPDLEQEERDCILWHLFNGNWVYHLGNDIYCRRANPLISPAARWEEEWVVVDYRRQKKRWAAGALGELKLSAGDKIRPGDPEFVQALASAIDRACDEAGPPRYPPEYRYSDFADDPTVHQDAAGALEKRFGQECEATTAFLLAAMDEIHSASSTYWCRSWKEEEFLGQVPFDDNYVPENKLCLAAFRGDSGVVREILAGGEDVDQRDYSLRPLDYAVKREHLETARMLLEAGSDVREMDVGGCTALHYAVNTGNIEIVRLLVEEGADINAGVKHAQSPLHLAAAHGSAEMIDYLVEHGAEVNALWEQYTPMDFAMARCRLDTVRFLTKHGGMFGISLKKRGNDP